ncbi:2-phospho-L-lactate guanylyltransferase [Nocardioides sp. JQ2195]|uniref:2-phospho-L-lactate guanylyltransferase n=1 Tax=Nocardioides sp. JQ2195 TaxID=2592334 RepID=UPI00143EA869|nr:2-phospho-L-lactate guanylyltransferase [Nocardioides sp. JQ2195]QIX26175.1 2-phospho-L-lactate guanylyltransferase [Nocardioides sp. JQ2195]
MSSPSSFVALVPVKPPAVGKSRLGTMPDPDRIRLATAFALDTIAAALAAERVADVMVVTDDFRFASMAREAGCSVLPDGVNGDLNATLEQAAHECTRRWPAHGLVALCADLPALHPTELSAALADVPLEGAAFVADAAGTGTTMYAARSLRDFKPGFGLASAQRHRSDGARLIGEDLASLRHDVDEAGDLGRAMVLGVGVHTAAAIHVWRPEVG